VIPDTLQALTVPVAQLRPYGRNPRRGDVAAIRASLQAHGQYRPLVVNRRSGEVLAGNHTLQAAVELGWTEVAVTYVDVDDEQAARIVLVDNRTNDLAGYDDSELAALLEGLPDLEGTGFEARDLERLLAALQTGREGMDTEPGVVPAEPVIRPGDLLLLGRHRLLCGDATSGGDLERLMDGHVADVLWTDPPYGVDYVGKTDDALRLRNDQGEQLRGLLDQSLPVIDAVLAASGRWYVAAPAGPRGTEFRNALDAAGWAFHQALVWVKDTMVLGHSDYHYRHEDVLYGYKPGPGRAGRGNHTGSRWYGDHAQTTVMEIPRPKASREHPTMKPVELVERCLRNSSVPGQLVLDPFAGAGSTLIACDNLDRCCNALELDPAYCDVIVDRWQRHTGRTAELVEQRAAV
jgi:DNA modification methylase